MAYITEGDVEKYLMQDIDGSYSQFLTDVIAMVTSYIEQYVGFSFENSASSDRYFDGTDTEELLIDPVQSITAVTVYDNQGHQLYTLTENTDYYLYPLNGSVKDRVILSGSGATTYFPEYGRSVKITGVWGYSTPPAAIKVAALKLVAKIVEKGLKGGEASAESLGEYSIDYKEIDETADPLGIKDILDMYRPIHI